MTCHNIIMFDVVIVNMNNSLLIIVNMICLNIIFY